MSNEEKLIVSKAIVLLEILRERETRGYVLENVDNVIKKLRLLTK